MTASRCDESSSSAVHAWRLWRSAQQEPAHFSLRLLTEFLRGSFINTPMVAKNYAKKRGFESYISAVIDRNKNNVTRATPRMLIGRHFAESSARC